MKQLTIKLPDEVKMKLKMYAAKKGLTMKAIIVEVIDILVEGDNG